MGTTDANPAWATVTNADPSLLDRPGLVGLLASIERVRRVCDAVEVEVVRRSRELADHGRGEPPENLLATTTGASSRSARTASTREQACDAMPAMESALADGTMSAGHIDAAAAVRARLDEPLAEQFADHANDLAHRARTVSVDVFERECRDLARHLQRHADADAEVAELERQHAASSVKRWVDRTTGMHNTLISLDPLRDSHIWKIINAEVAAHRQHRRDAGDPPLSFAALQADAVVAAIVAQPDASPRPRVPEVSVLIDYETLTGHAATAGIVCETDNGTPLPAATIRRLCCDAHIIPTILNSTSVVLDQGRRVRTATVEQRTAIAAMHRACGFPHCTVDITACRIHHIRWWWKHDGPTDLDNLIPLCEHHHHLVHEGRWGLTMTRDRIATFTRPDGTIHQTESTLDRRPHDIPMLT
jgi:hypothetical protein